MSSKGTQVYGVRLPMSLCCEVQSAIARRNSVSPAAPWTLSDFVRTALAEKLQKMRRSRRPHRRRGQAPSLAVPGAIA
jgi:hypothetical protein